MNSKYVPCVCVDSHITASAVRFLHREILSSLTSTPTTAKGSLVWGGDRPTQTSIAEAVMNRNLGRAESSEAWRGGRAVDEGSAAPSQVRGVWVVLQPLSHGRSPSSPLISTTVHTTARAGFKPPVPCPRPSETLQHPQAMPVLPTWSLMLPKVPLQPPTPHPHPSACLFPKVSCSPGPLWCPFTLLKIPPPRPSMVPFLSGTFLDPSMPDSLSFPFPRAPHSTQQPHLYSRSHFLRGLLSGTFLDPPRNSLSSPFP